MPKLTVLVDDETAFEGQVPQWTLPTYPEQFPNALQSQPGMKPPPLAKLMMLTALIEVFRRALNNQNFQPISVDVKTQQPGSFTMLVEMAMYNPHGELEA
jgi:hypothetical protein